jgi:hypothetical protein
MEPSADADGRVPAGALRVQYAIAHEETPPHDLTWQDLAFGVAEESDIEGIPEASLLWLRASVLEGSSGDPDWVFYGSMRGQNQSVDVVGHVSNTEEPFVTFHGAVDEQDKAVARCCRIKVRIRIVITWPRGGGPDGPPPEPPRLVVIEPYPGPHDVWCSSPRQLRNRGNRTVEVTYREYFWNEGPQCDPTQTPTEFSTPLAPGAVHYLGCAHYLRPSQTCVWRKRWELGPEKEI